MTFRRRVRLDPGQVRDLRGMGGGRIGSPVVLAGGGGLGVALLLVVFQLLTGGDLGGILGGPGAAVPGDAPGAGTLAARCRTGADANAREDCRVVGFTNSVQAFWSDRFADAGLDYRAADSVLFDGAVDTACGTATSEVGPFYCPDDETAYLDLGFLDALLEGLGARAAPFAQGYVIAHEFGHHVQDLTGTLAIDADPGPNGRSVGVELQADCYAGAWAGEAAATGFLEPPSRRELDDALDAAAAVGDDRVQRQVGGGVDPESWTHGSAAQRQRWFLVGFESHDPGGCDTFSASP